jgi:hypothetical protein
MGFIIGLPKSDGKTDIVIVVDQLTKYAHFSSLYHHFKASRAATTFMETVQNLHGLSKIIVSEEIQFSLEIFGLNYFLFWVLNWLTAQFDGETKIMNQFMEGYLRCFAYNKQTQWVKWFPLV